MLIKNLHFYFWLFFCMFVLMSCSKDNDPDPDPGPDPHVVPDPPPHGSVAERTVLIYMGGDNDLDTKGLTAKDLDEMKEAIKTMDANLYSHNNLLIFYDQYSETLRPRLYRLIKKGEVIPSETDPDKKELVIVTEEELIYEYPQEITFTKPAILKEVMDMAFDEFPAKSYGFVYWSHGEGWLPVKSQNMAIRSLSPLRWMGLDKNNKSDSFKSEISELADVLKLAPKRFDFILFDACFMLSLESSYELRDCADFIISSPTETPGPGAPYTEVVPMMFASSQAAIKMAEAYFKYYNDKYNPNVKTTNSNWTGGVSLGVLDCAKLTKLADVTKANLSTSSNLNTLLNEIFDYDKRNYYSHVGYYDMVQLMEKVLKPTGVDEWKNAFNDALPYWKTTPKNYSSSYGMFSMEGTNGVSHYIPSGESTATRDADYRNTAWYKDAGLSQLGW